MNNLPLPLQVWLMNQGLNYDANSDPDYFSATELLKPVQQIVLSRRLGVSNPVPDVTKSYQAAMGSALHQAIEDAWKHPLVDSLKALGFNQSTAEKVQVNPDDPSNCIPVWMEQRVLKQIGQFTIGGKYDFIFDGQLYDIKTVTVSKWNHKANTKDYQLQGSIYKWLSPDKITSDTIRICYVFRDWSQHRSMSPGYPPRPFMTQDVELLSPVQTEVWIKERLRKIENNKDVPVNLIERCSEEELWMTPTKYKYFTREGQQRATKVFTNASEAYTYLQDKGTGRLSKEQGKPLRCGWCPAFSICEQKNEYFSR